MHFQAKKDVFQPTRSACKAQSEATDLDARQPPAELRPELLKPESAERCVRAAFQSQAYVGGGKKTAVNAAQLPLSPQRRPLFPSPATAIVDAHGRASPDFNSRKWQQFPHKGTAFSGVKHLSTGTASRPGMNEV